MTNHYQGPIREHAAFWVAFRELPHEKRFPAFIDFFKRIEREVREGKCTLRNAGYALEPGYYDKAIQEDPHGGDMTIVCLRAADLASWGYEDQGEAREDWEQVVGIMGKYG